MQKIPTLFEREFGADVDCPATEAVTPGCEWVLAGSGTPFYKLDGSACLCEGNALYRRKTLREGQYEDGPPTDWRPAQDEPRGNGKWPGWVRCDRNDPADQYHFAALENTKASDGVEIVEGATYELVGPKVQGNPHGWDNHFLIRHTEMEVPNGNGPGADGETTYRLIREWLEYNADWEGIVWRHDKYPDVMAKIKRTDFGLDWPVE